MVFIVEGVPMKILLVEDNPLNRDVLSRRLTRRGYEVVTAVDGEEALLQACAEAPDIVLMDLNMPKLNGWDATKRLKQMPETMHLRVIALSAHALSGDQAKAIAAGCDAYVSKPVDFEHLLSLIESGNSG
jgi:two-component system response regulator